MKRCIALQHTLHRKQRWRSTFLVQLYASIAVRQVSVPGAAQTPHGLAQGLGLAVTLYTANTAVVSPWSTRSEYMNTQEWCCVHGNWAHEAQWFEGDCYSLWRQVISDLRSSSGSRATGNAFIQRIQQLYRPGTQEASTWILKNGVVFMVTQHMKLHHLKVISIRCGVR